MLHEVGEAASTVSSSRSKPCSSSAAAIWLADWSDSMPDNPEVNRRMMAMYWAASSFTAERSASSLIRSTIGGLTPGSSPGATDGWPVMRPRGGPADTACADPPPAVNWRLWSA